MDSHQLAKRLLSMDRVLVMFEDPNSNGGPFEVTGATLREAEEDEFPEDYNMPAGFKFIVLTN